MAITGLHIRHPDFDIHHALGHSQGIAELDQPVVVIINHPCQQILHFLELDPSGKHIALGADLDGCDELPRGFDGVQSYPAMAAKLLERGVSAQMVEDIFWNNALGVMKRAVCNHAG